MLIPLTCLISLFILAPIYPHHFILLDRKFMDSPDAGVPFINTFALVSQFFHGGLQLFDRFDQLSYVYAHMSAGVYALDNLVVAFIYLLLSPFSNNPGHDFHHVFSIGFYVFTALMRAIGGYLLLGIFVQNKWVILASLVYLNTFLSTQTMYEGHISQSLYSFLPLLLYFILRFFQHWRLNDLLAITLMMMIAVSNSPLFGLGYFYLIAHVFTLACLGHAFMAKQSRAPIWPSWHWPMPQTWGKIAAVFIVGGLIILPIILMVPALQSDFHIEGSGLGQTTGRVNNAFKPSQYFQVSGKTFANPLAFLFQSVDFEHWVWGAGNWIFLGIAVLAFSFLGWALSRDSRKHIFGFSILAIILLNVATYPGNWSAFFLYLRDLMFHPMVFFKQGGSLAQMPITLMLSASGLVHWLNVLTNPFSFLLRSFHVPALFMPYLFLPLIALGLGTCVDLARGRDEGIYRKRLGWVIGFFGIMLALGVTGTAGLVRVYACLGILAFILFLFCAQYSSLRRKFWFGVVLLSYVVLADIVALYVYARQYPYSNQITPQNFYGLPTDSQVVVEYQNPKILPWREYGRTQGLGSRLISVENYYGLFYQFCAFDRFMVPPNIYTPVPLARL